MGWVIYGAATKNFFVFAGNIGAVGTSLFYLLTAHTLTSSEKIRTQLEVIAVFFSAVLVAGVIFRKRLPRMTATIGGLSVIIVVLGIALMNTHFLAEKVQIDQGSNVNVSNQNN